MPHVQPFWVPKQDVALEQILVEGVASGTDTLGVNGSVRVLGLLVLRAVSKGSYGHTIKVRRWTNHRARAQYD